MKKKVKKKLTKTKRKDIFEENKILFWVGISITLFLSFMYGYILGLQHEHSSFISSLIPEFLINENNETEMLSKTFLIKGTIDNKKVSIENTVSFPHSWYFDVVEVESDNENITNTKVYVLSSPNENVKLIITPKGINDLRSVMSTSIQTTLVVMPDEGVEKRCLGSYDVPESDEFEYISLYRENIDEEKIRYVQEVESVANPAERALILDEFLVFKRDGGFIKGDEHIWTADISLEFDESISDDEKEVYLKIVDDIISSLQIK